MSLGNDCKRRSDEICFHDQGFTFHAFKNQMPLPGAWFCAMDCGFHLNFDPEWAGRVHPKVTKGMLETEYRTVHWTGQVLGYLPEPRPSANKTWKASTGGKY